MHSAAEYVFGVVWPQPLVSAPTVSLALRGFALAPDSALLSYRAATNSTTYVGTNVAVRPRGTLTRIARLQFEVLAVDPAVQYKITLLAERKFSSTQPFHQSCSLTHGGRRPKKPLQFTQAC